MDIGAYEYPHIVSAEEQIHIDKINLSVYPNPVNLNKRGGSFYCTVSFNLPSAGKAEVSIYNIKGQKIRTLLNTNTAPGEYNMQWDGLNDTGNKVGTGVYFVRISTPFNDNIERVVMIK